VQPAPVRADSAAARKLTAEIVQHRRTFRGLAPLVRLQAIADFVPRDQLMGLVSGLLNTNGMDPRLRVEVTRFLAELHWTHSDTAAADEQLRMSGMLVDGWWLLGPVPADAVALTAPVDLDASLPGRPDPVAWRDVSRVWPFGVLPVGALVSPGDDDAAVVIAMNHLFARRSQTVVLSGGAGQRVEIAVNGALAAPDGSALLRKGWNRILVRSSPPERGPWALSVHMAHTDGRAWLARTRGVAPRDVRVPRPGTPAQAQPTLLAEWQRLSDPRHLADRAAVLAARGDLEDTTLTDALETDADPSLLREAARQARRSDVAIRYLRTLLQQDSLDSRAWAGLARRHHERGQSLAALDEVRRAIATAPHSLRARLLEAEILADLQALGVAQGKLLAMLVDHPRVPAVLRALASVYQRRQLPEAALDRFAQLGQVTNDRGDVLYWRYEIARGLGRAEEATELLQQLVRLRPDVPGHRVALGRLYEDLNQPEKAQAALDAALALFPRDADLSAAAGAMLLRTGARARGLALMHRALKLRPHQPDLRERVEALEAGGARFEQRYRLDAVKLAAETTRPGRDAPAVEYLVSQRISRLFDDGTSAVWTQHVVRVNRVAPTDRQRAWSVVYDPSRQSVKVLAARRLRAGRAIDDAEQTDSALGESWYGLYYEQRATTIRFHDVQPGDVLVVEHRLSDFGRNLYGGTFSDLVGVQDREPKRRVRIAWIVPPAQNFDVRLLGGAGDGRTPVADSTVDGMRVLELDMRDVPALQVEPSMPGYTEVGQYAHATTFRDWNDVARWYRALVATQLTAGPALERQARALVPAGATVDATVAALHDFVARRIRYVGLEFGEHGYKPYAVNDILGRRFGDCKDKASLLKAMLAVHNIDSDLVLVRTRRQGAVDARAVSAAIFDHAILHVPAVGTYLDATAAYNGPGELPGADQGASALVVTSDAGRFVSLPVVPATQSVLRRHLRLKVGAQSVGVDGRVSAGGMMAPPLRERFSAAASRRERLEQLLTTEYPRLVLDQAAFKDVEAMGRPVSFHFTGALGSWAGGVELISGELSLVRQLAGLDSRKHALVIAHPFAWEWRFDIQLQDGLRATVGRTGAVKSPFGHVSLDVADTADGVRMTLRVQIDVARVEPAEYTAFRRFLRRADEVVAGARRLEVQRAP